MSDKTLELLDDVVNIVAQTIGELNGRVRQLEKASDQGVHIVRGIDLNIRARPGTLGQLPDGSLWQAEENDWRCIVPTISEVEAQPLPGGKAKLIFHKSDGETLESEITVSTARKTKPVKVEAAANG